MLNPPARHPVARRVAFLVTVAAALAVVAAACGGGSSKSTATTTTPPTTAAAAAGGGGGGGGGGGRGLGTQLNAFRSCMAAQGEPLPTFAPRTTTTGGSGSTAAPDTGGPGGGFGGGGGGGGGRFLGGGAGGGGLAVFLRGLDQNDPKVMAAYNACKSQIPAALIQAQQQRSQALTAFISCMSDHGVTISTTARTPGSPPSTIDQTTTAYQTCKVLLPTGGAFGPGRTTTTTSGA